MNETLTTKDIIFIVNQMGIKIYDKYTGEEPTKRSDNIEYQCPKCTSINGTYIDITLEYLLDANDDFICCINGKLEYINKMYDNIHIDTKKKKKRNEDKINRQIKQTDDNNAKDMAYQSNRGFTYQKYYATYVLLTYKNIQYIREEGKDDIEILYEDNQKELIQLKYLDSEPESLQYESGLYTTIIKHCKNHKHIKAIKYVVFNKKNDSIHRKIKHIFDNKNTAARYNIGLYCIFLIYNNVSDQKILYNNNEINITHIDNICDLYNQNKTELKKFYDDKKFNDIYDVFTDRQLSMIYFNKFELPTSFSFVDIEKKICDNIYEKYDKLLTNDRIKINIYGEIIMNYIISIFAKSIFNRSRLNYCQLEAKDVYLQIEQFINKLDIKLIERKCLLEYEENIKINEQNNTLSDFELNNMIVKIKSFTFETHDQIRFFMGLLKRKSALLTQQMQNDIRSYICNYALKMYKSKDDNDYIKQFIGNIKNIIDQNHTYHISLSNIIEHINSDNDYKNHYNYFNN